MLDREPVEREVSRIAGRKPAAKRYRRGADQTVGLLEGLTASSELPTPLSGAPTFGLAEGSFSQPGEESPS